MSKENGMAQEDKEYLNALQKQWGYFAIYPPNRVFALGDYGKREGDEFEKLGNIRRWIEPKPQSKAGGNMLFTSQGDVKTDLDFGVADKTGQCAVNVHLSFGKKWSIFFLAQNTTIVTTGNLMRVGERMVAEYKESGKDWQLSYDWIEELVEAEVLTVVIALEADSKATISGKLPLKYQGLPVGDLDLRNFSVSRTAGTVSAFGPIPDATPLAKLYQVKDSAFKPATYEEVH